MRYAIALLAATVALAIVAAGDAPAKSSQVLRVGKHAPYKTIQSAVNAAHKGDWILIAPGDYKGAVRIRTDGLHLRGMSRSGVIVDGTKSGPACSSKARDQNFKRGDDGNGIVVDKANGVWIENLTACNFLGEGNQIWWNGGDGSGKIGMTSWYGSFLTATSTYFNGKKPFATYGIFASNAKGPGLLTDSYGSNMEDSSFYVGACHPCNAMLNRLHGQYNLDGYSGTNSSGVTVENSEFDHNTEGLTTNSQNNDDAPSPQLGSTFIGNFVHDNNNPNVPHSKGSLHAVGSGMVIPGGRNNVIKNNRVENNGAWGILLAPFPDSSKPPKVAHCQGGVVMGSGKSKSCFFDDFNNEVASNTFSGNGFFGNPTNGDMGDISGQNDKSNCWHDNVRADGSPVVSEPSDLQSTHAVCGQPGHGDDLASELAAQALCDTELAAPCKRDATHNYPRPTKVVLHKLPKLRGMKDACAGVPANPWCPRKAAHAAAG
jgi:Periplasmic copper-binding protein (NosD)